MGEVDDGVDGWVDGLQQAVGADDVGQPLKKSKSNDALRNYREPPGLMSHQVSVIVTIRKEISHVREQKLFYTNSET